MTILKKENYFVELDNTRLSGKITESFLITKAWH